MSTLTVRAKSLLQSQIRKSLRYSIYMRRMRHFWGVITVFPCYAVWALIIQSFTDKQPLQISSQSGTPGNWCLFLEGSFLRCTSARYSGQLRVHDEPRKPQRQEIISHTQTLHVFYTTYAPPCVLHTPKLRRMSFGLVCSRNWAIDFPLIKLIWFALPVWNWLRLLFCFLAEVK